MQFDLHAVHRQATETFFKTYEEIAEGALATDRDAKIVWINEKYLQFLGLENRESVIGHYVDDVIPGSLIPYVLEKGRPILLDVMEFPKGWCIVSRFPLFDEDGKVQGAFGFVLYEGLSEILPLMKKVRQLQGALFDAENSLKRARKSKYSFGQFVGTSPEALNVKRQARIAAQKELTVVLTGETGTGKEILAQAIHSSSARSEGNFVAVNVSAIPEALLEAEFFGAAPGAYTGLGRSGREGKIQLANGGTLFLDEVADMPLSMQTKLLRAIQEREIEPLGANKVVKLDIRLIAATSRNLIQLVDDGLFRSDLYYRLNVFPIEIPPLRSRIRDIRAIAESILEEISSREGFQFVGLDEEAAQYLQGHSWPGNVRELRNYLERAVAESGGGDIVLSDIKKALPKPVKPDEGAGLEIEEEVTMAEAIAELERTLIRRSLARHSGKKQEAAESLGMPKSTFYQKLKEHNL